MKRWRAQDWMSWECGAVAFGRDDPIPDPDDFEAWGMVHIRVFLDGYPLGEGWCDG